MWGLLYCYYKMTKHTDAVWYFYCKTRQKTDEEGDLEVFLLLGIETGTIYSCEAKPVICMKEKLTVKDRGECMISQLWKKELFRFASHLSRAINMRYE